MLFSLNHSHSSFLKVTHEGVQLDLQKQFISGVNSPAAVSSPSCEVRNELVFPSLPQTQGSGQQQTQQSQPPEATKITPKISQLLELDQQLSKLHNQRPVLTQQQSQSMSKTYSEAVRQSPTTVQQQIVQPNVNQQVQAPSQPVQNIQATNQVLSPVPSQPPIARKLSRFVISKVTEEQPKASSPPQQINQNQSQQTLQGQLANSIVNSSESDQQANIQQNLVQSPCNNVPQQNQAQMFFQQHHGGVVSVYFNSTVVDAEQRRFVVACSCFIVDKPSFCFCDHENFCYVTRTNSRDSSCLILTKLFLKKFFFSFS